MSRGDLRGSAVPSPATRSASPAIGGGRNRPRCSPGEARRRARSVMSRRAARRPRRDRRRPPRRCCGTPSTSWCSGPGSACGVVRGGGRRRRRRRPQGRLGPGQVVARGPRRSRPPGQRVAVAWTPPSETAAEVVAHLRRRGVAGRRIVVQRDGGAPLFAEAVAASAAEVIDVPVYRWDLPDDVTPAGRLIEAAAAGGSTPSPSHARPRCTDAFELGHDPAGLAGGPRRDVLAVAVGPVTADALREAASTGGRARPGPPRVDGARARRLRSTATRPMLSPAAAEVRWQGLALPDPDGRTSSYARRGPAPAILWPAPPAVVSKADSSGPVPTSTPPRRRSPDCGPSSGRSVPGSGPSLAGATPVP